MHLPKAIPTAPWRRGGAAAALLVALLLATTTARAAAPTWSASGPFPGIGTGHAWQVVFSPADNTLVLAATDNGVYASHDAGQTWAIAGMAGTRVWTVGFDARNAAIAFAGLAGGGVRISHDSGKTWADASAGLPDRNVRCFAFSFSGIAAGTDNGVAFSADGASWHRGGLDGYGVSALGVAANSPAPLFVAGVDRGNVAAGYLFRSSGNGQWAALGNGLPQGAVVSWIAVGPLSTTVTTRPIIVTTSKGTLRSGDSGNTWTASTLPQDATISPTTAVFSPLDPSLVYAGADAGGSSGGGLLRSTDGGATFTESDSGMPTPGPNNQPPPQREVESITVAATTPPTVVAALNPSQGTATAYREVDSTAPAPPVLVTEPGTVATLPPVAATPLPTHTQVSSQTGPTPTPTPGVVARVAGAVFHFPIPIVPEVLLIALLVFLYLRWKRRYYVEGPP